MRYVDPVQVSPGEYRTVLEDGGVRVLEMVIPPGVSDVEHSHPTETVYFISGGKARIHLPDGSADELEIPDGMAMRHPPWTHRVENVGDTEIRAVIFENVGELA